MSKRAKVIVAILVGVIAVIAIAAIAAPTIYRQFFTEPPAETPTLSADDSALDSSSGDGSALDPANLTGEWRVVEGSSAGYRVDEVLNGSPVTVTGRTDQVTGSLAIDALTLQAADLEVDVASISTDSTQRDRYFRDEALRASEHPTASFVLDSPVTIATAPASGEVVEQTLEGDLTIAGATQRVTFTAQLQSDGETTRIAGQIPIVFADFGIAAPSLGFVSVEPTGFVEFDLIAAKS